MLLQSFCAIVMQTVAYTLPPDKLAKALHLYQARILLHFAGPLWTILALWLLIYFRAGWKIQNFAARLSGKRWLQGCIAIPAWLLLLTGIGLPAELLGQRIYRSYGLSVQSWPNWFRDWGISLVLTLVFGTLGILVLYWLIRKSPRRWWFWAWVLAVPFEIFAIYAIPVVIDPLFNHFQPLAQSDPALVDQLERVVARGHMQIPPRRMFVMDASAKLTGANAYVTGFGASKRVVVWDNTIKRVPQEEILMIYGHEQGHYVLHHIVKGLVFFGILMLVFFWIAYKLMNFLLVRYGTTWHIPSAHDWSSLGLVLLLMTALSFFSEPIGNSFSRWIEHQADIYGIEVTHGIVPDTQKTGVTMEQRLGEMWLDYPYPNNFVVFWTYTHPPTADRLEFAAHYDPWQPGQHPLFVTK